MKTDARYLLNDRGGAAPEPSLSLADTLSRAGIDQRNPDRLLATLPFAGDDITAGSETELQVAVRGTREAVDLPQTIDASRYMANLLKRARSGDSPDRLAASLEDYLSANTGMLWENSEVRIPRQRLHPAVRTMLDGDLRADKRDPRSSRRSDAGRFLVTSASGEEQLRVPVSYMIKLALADALECKPEIPAPVADTGRRLMGHFLNDNSSPETFSFHVVPMRADAGMGRALARETAKRFLLTDLLVRYANRRFGLEESGQQSLIYFNPLPPQRQRTLNSIIPDSFYRELFMSPCLSGWDEGEKKHRYMHLCHEVLSRSQINAVAKLREAGIVANNLVVLPTLSNTSLANNGVHISLGSRQLGARLADPASGFGAVQEKLLGDLAIKIAEHFLPLFVGTYTAAPYRLGFADFHPERALGFLPHQLDYTHLRMLWRRWRKKAQLSICGHTLTPFGPERFDRNLSALFQLRGDYVPDFRLLDYPVCFLSTPRSPAFDGRLGNHLQLKEDLAEMGVIDRQMSLYLFLKPREYATMGFSGIEGRHYSQFESFGRDLGHAASLQALVMAFAYQLIATGVVSHTDIPDTPEIESERRQVFFGTAINLPTFFVRADTRNHFLARILARTRNTRSSRRYPGYLRVHHHEYRAALLEMLREQAAGLVDSLRLGSMMDDLKMRLGAPVECGTAGRLTRGILERLNVRDPMAADAGEFNRAAEEQYRDTLAKRHLAEAIDYLERDCQRLDQAGGLDDSAIGTVLSQLLSGQTATVFLRRIKDDLLADRLDEETLRRLIHLVIFAVHRDQLRSRHFLDNAPTGDASPVHRAG